MYQNRIYYALCGLGEEEGLHAVLEGVVAHVLHGSVPTICLRRMLCEGGRKTEWVNKQACKLPCFSG